MTGSEAPMLDLEEFLASGLPGETPRRRLVLIAALGRSLRSAHEKGGGLPLGETLPVCWRPERGEAEFTGLDRRDASSSPDRVLRDLSRLQDACRGEVSRSRRFRFLKAYLGHSGRLRDARSLVMEIARRAQVLARKRLRSQEWACLGNNQDFARERYGWFQIHRRRDRRTEEILQELLPDPDRVFAAGVPLSDRGSGCQAARVEIGGRSYFLKRFDCRGPLFRVKNVLRRSRARRVWQVAWAILQRRLPTPVPLLLLEERHFRLLGRSYVLFEFQPEAVRMKDLWPALDESGRKRLIAAAGVLFGRLHRSGCLHGDSNWDNLLLAGEGLGALLLVDLDCGRLPGRMTHASARKDLDHFLRDLHRPRNQGGDFEALFLEVWRRWLFPVESPGRSGKEGKSRLPLRPEPC